MDKVGIVVLNYLNYKDTIECINSLLDIEYNNYDIVVVDNGSKNDSYKILKDEFSCKDKVEVLYMSKNLGYAKGNNFGIDYCRKELHVDHVMVINNDTIIEDKDIINTFLKYKNEGILLGPKIINLDGENQNPVYYSSIFKVLFKKFAFFILNFLNLYTLVRGIYRFFNKKNNKVNTVNKEVNNRKYVLHGSCIFFTNQFFDYYNGFFNKTFLYFEEFILNLMLKKVNSKMVYIEDTYIIHKEDCSSEEAFSNEEFTKLKYEIVGVLWFLILYFIPYTKIKNMTSEVE